MNDPSTSHLCAKRQISDLHHPLQIEEAKLWPIQINQVNQVFHKDPGCKICQYYSIFNNPEYRFIRSPERWEHARDECGITICLNHISLFLLREKWRMVYTDNVGEAQRVGRPLLPTFFCDVNGTLVYRSTIGSKNYWKRCSRRLNNGIGH